MDIHDMAEIMREKARMATDFRHKVVFDFGESGAIQIDASETPAKIAVCSSAADLEDDMDVETTLRLSPETMAGFLNGTKDPNIAFMTGKLKVSGKMGVAMKLNALLED